jgi:hypothetical protein
MNPSLPQKVIDDALERDPAADRPSGQCVRPGDQEES